MNKWTNQRQKRRAEWRTNHPLDSGRRLRAHARVLWHESLPSKRQHSAEEGTLRDPEDQAIGYTVKEDWLDERAVTSVGRDP